MNGKLEDLGWELPLIGMMFGTGPLMPDMSKRGETEYKYEGSKDYGPACVATFIRLMFMTPPL
jgi:hypothetical protein